MNAGTELDRAVAEALGQVVCEGKVRRDSYNFLYCNRCDGDVTAPAHHPIPPYSTSWEAAGRLVEMLRGRGWVVNLRALKRDGWRVWLCRDDGNDFHHWETEGPSAPAALALAALKALGGKP